jgi:hypothetical protein
VVFRQSEEEGMSEAKWSVILVVMACLVMLSATTHGDPIKVALYADDGTGSSKDDVADALSDTTLFEVTYVMGADIRSGILQNFDVVIHPGGSGSGQAASLEESGRDSVRAFVGRGGGYLGICAGAYLVSSDYSWSLYLLNTRVVDKAHWARGNGPTDVRFNKFARELFGFEQDTLVIEYRQGPLMARAYVDSLPDYIQAGVFESEIAENGAPSGVMIGTTAFAFSVFGEGRVAAFSPHPEITTGKEHMVADAVQWLAGDDPFLAITSPRELERWEAGSYQTIEWVSEAAEDTVLIEFSPDSGSTWDPVASNQVGPYDWTVADSTDACFMRVESMLSESMADTVLFAINPPQPTITSASGGNWSDPGTWIGGVVPDSTDNVRIGVGHNVIVDTGARCDDISFMDDTGRLSMQADLYIYGDFYRNTTSANPFYSGGNLWDAGAKMVFTGDAEVQTIHNLGTTSTSPYPLRLRELVIDKSSGKFTTNPVEGTEEGYRLGIGTSLEVVNGTFELGRRDDIEGRSTWGSATTPTITVYENGFFHMLGSYSHIRRGNFIGDDSSKIGKITIFGEAWLANSSSNRLNCTDIDVEDGGHLKIPWYSGGGSMGAGRFNPGTVTVKDGGLYTNSLITDIWYESSETPNVMVVEAGGVVESKASAPVYPNVTSNEGTFVYSRQSSDQAVYDMDYHNLELSEADPGVLKTWDLGADRMVAGELEIHDGAQLVLSADVPESVTVVTSLRMTSGSIDNSDPDVFLTMADGSTINRATGTISNAPVFAGMVDVRYLSSVASVTTGPELPTAPDVIDKLQIWSTDQTVTLGANAQVNGELTLSHGVFDNDGAGGTETLTVADGAEIRRGSGSLTAAPTFAGTVDVSYISTLTPVTTGPELPGATGVLADLTLSGDQGVTLGADVTVNGACTISGSDLVTDAFTVTLAPTAELTEADSITVVGNVTATRTVSQSVNETFGGIGLELTADGAAPGATTVLRVTGTAKAIGDTAGVLRYFDITPTNNTGLDATVVFHYDQSELNGIAEADLTTVSIEAGGSDLQNYGGVIDEPANTLTSSGIDVLETLTLGPASLAKVDPGEVPKLTRLISAYPNPFGPSTTIAFELSRPTRVNISIFDVMGRKVATLQDGMMGPDLHTVTWRGLSDDGRRLASGVYLCRMVAGDVTQTAKVALLRR